MRLSAVQRGLVVDVVQRDVPQAAELEAEVRRVGHGQRDDQRLVRRQVEVADRRVLGGQPARRQARRDHRVHRQGVVEPLRELQPRLDALHKLLTGDGVTLFDQLAGQRRRCGARRVGARDR